MKKLAALHMRLAVLYAIIGMTLGNYMGGVHDFTLMPVHAHINLLGWVSMMIYALVYLAFKDRDVTKLMKAHFWVAHLSLVGMTGGLTAMFLAGVAEPIVALASVATLVSMIMFAVIIFGLTKVE